MFPFCAFAAVVLVLGCEIAAAGSSGKPGVPFSRDNSSPEIPCNAEAQSHLQGITTDRKGAIYWCFTRDIVKTDMKGRILERVAVKSHHGDLAYHDGKIYVAVNFGGFSRKRLADTRADSWVYVYDAKDLSFVSRHRIPEVVHGAGGMAYHNGRFIVIGGLSEEYDENFAYEYDERFRFIRRHVIKSGYTQLGIQTACYNAGYWWFGCYGNELLRTDKRFRLVGKYKFSCAEGWVGLSDNSFLKAFSRKKNDKYSAKALTYRIRLSRSAAAQ